MPVGYVKTCADVTNSTSTSTWNWTLFKHNFGPIPNTRIQGGSALYSQGTLCWVQTRLTESADYYYTGSFGSAGTTGVNGKSGYTKYDYGRS